MCDDTKTDCEAAAANPEDSDKDIDYSVAVQHLEESRDIVDGIVN
jgi:hypothetical protein